MEIHILLAGVEFGPYTDEKARELISDGFLAATDPAKRLDETEWIPLTDVLAHPSPAAPAEEAAPWDELEPVQEEAPLPAFAEETPVEEPAAIEAWPEPPPESESEAEPVPEIIPRPAPIPPSVARRDTSSIPAPPKTLPIPAARTASLEKPASPAAPIPPSAPRLSAPPLAHVTVPSRAKARGATRTGSLLVKEALQAARSRVGAMPPAALTAPLPALKKSFTGKIADKGLVEPPSNALPPAQETVPEPPAPPTVKPRSKIVLRDRAQDEPPAPKTRKTIRLTQPIALVPGAMTSPLPPVAPELKVQPPALQIPGPMRRTGKFAPSQVMRTKPLSIGRRTSSLMPPPAPPQEAAPDKLPDEAPDTTAEMSPPSPVLPEAAASVTASGDLAEKRSLKITGSLKQLTPRTPIRLTTSFPYHPGDSGKLELRPDEGTTSPRPPSGPMAPASKIWGPESPAVRPTFSPTAKIPSSAPAIESPRLDTRPPSTKIPVSEMPPEGLKVRSTRRLTGRVQIPPTLKAPPELPAAPPEIGELSPPAPILPPPSFTEPEVQAPMEIEEPVSEAPPVSEPVPVTEALASSPDLARPDKIRLRRPVKLELSSRAKLGESGRLSLEAFSKMAPADPLSRPPSQFLPPLEIEAPPATPRPGLPAEGSGSTGLTPATTHEIPETIPLTTVEDVPAPRLREVRMLKVPLLSPRRKDKWLWVAYAIIAAGMLAWLLLLYLATHRHGTEPASTTTSSPPTTPAPGVAVAPPPVTPPAPAASAPVTPPAPNVSDQVGAYVTDGIGSFQKGDLDSALAAFNHALDLDPKSADALYNRGLTKAAQDDSDGAISDFTQALQIDTKLAQAYYARGLARHSKGDLDGALSDYNLAVQNDPHDALAFFNRGLIRMQKDDVDGAIVDSGRALELDPRLIQSYYNRGLGRLAKGALDAALSDMRTFCTLAPQDAYTDYARLYIWLIRTQQNQLAEANTELSQSMNSGWNGAADAMVTKIGEFLLGQTSETDLLAAAASPIPLKEQGQHCEAWYFIGMRRLESGDKENAVVDLRKCVETQKTDYCEYILAQEQLKTLNPGSPVTSEVTPAK